MKIPTIDYAKPTSRSWKPLVKRVLVGVLLMVVMWVIYTNRYVYFRWVANNRLDAMVRGLPIVREDITIVWSRDANGQLQINGIPQGRKLDSDFARLEKIAGTSATADCSPNAFSIVLGGHSQVDGLTLRAIIIDVNKARQMDAEIVPVNIVVGVTQEGKYSFSIIKRLEVEPLRSDHGEIKIIYTPGWGKSDVIWKNRDNITTTLTCDEKDNFYLH